MSMDLYARRYNLGLAAAWVRGHALATGIPPLDPELLDMPLEVLLEKELAAIVEAGAGLG